MSISRLSVDLAKPLTIRPIQGVGRDTIDISLVARLPEACAARRVISGVQDSAVRAALPVFIPDREQAHVTIVNPTYELFISGVQGAEHDKDLLLEKFVLAMRGIRENLFSLEPVRFTSLKMGSSNVKLTGLSPQLHSLRYFIDRAINDIGDNRLRLNRISNGFDSTVLRFLEGFNESHLNTLSGILEEEAAKVSDDLLLPFPGVEMLCVKFGGYNTSWTKEIAI